MNTRLVHNFRNNNPDGATTGHVSNYYWCSNKQSDWMPNVTRNGHRLPLSKKRMVLLHQSPSPQATSLATEPPGLETSATVKPLRFAKSKAASSGMERWRLKPEHTTSANSNSNCIGAAPRGGLAVIRTRLPLSQEGKYRFCRPWAAA
jgi:hypothetical protein